MRHWCSEEPSSTALGIVTVGKTHLTDEFRVLGKAHSTTMESDRDMSWATEDSIRESKAEIARYIIDKKFTKSK